MENEGLLIFNFSMFSCSYVPGPGIPYFFRSIELPVFAPRENPLLFFFEASN